MGNKNFKFKVMDEEHDEECDEWNAESTLKLKEIVVSAREQFKWQTAGADDTFRLKSFEEWLEPRNFALRPLYWEISSEAYTALKRGTRATRTRNVSECADVKCSDKIQKGVRRG